MTRLCPACRAPFTREYRSRARPPAANPTVAKLAAWAGQDRWTVACQNDHVFNVRASRNEVGEPTAYDLVDAKD